MTALFATSVISDRLTFAALILIVAAPAAFGCQPPWASGFLLAAVMSLASAYILTRVAKGQSWLFGSAKFNGLLFLLLAWLIAGVVRDGMLGPLHQPARLPALSGFKLGYVGAFFSAAILGAGFSSTSERLAQLLRACLMLGVVLAGFALLQSWGWDVKKLAGWTADASRPSGFYTNANRFAVLMTLCWMCGIGLLLDRVLDGRRDSPREGFFRILIGLALVLVSVCIALTLSRLTIVAAALSLFAVSVAWLALSRARPAEEWAWLPFAKRAERVALVALPLVVVAAWGVWCLMVASSSLSRRIADIQSDLSLESRIQMVCAALPLVHEQPVWGQGLGAFETSFAAIQPAQLPGRWRELHCDWMQLAIEAGIPAMLLALVLACAWFAEIWKRVRERESNSLLRILPAAGVGVFLLCSAADFPLREPASATLFFFVAGALCASTAERNAPTPFRLSGLLGLGAAAAMLGCAFVSGRNGFAYAESPWMGNFYCPTQSADQFAAWEKAARLDPGDPELQFRSATAAFAASARDLKFLDFSRDAANAARRLQPNDHRFPWIAAAVAERSGDLARAAEFREQAVARCPNDPVLREQNGRFYLNTQVRRSIPGEPARDAGLQRCFENFLVVLACTPGREYELIDALEGAGCLNQEIVALWPGDLTAARLRRARFYCLKQQWGDAERELPNAEPAGISDKQWYHVIRGAIALRRGALNSGMEELKLGVADRNEPETAALDHFIADEVRDLEAENCESLAGELLPELVKYPALASILAGKMMGARHWAGADRVLEKVAGQSPELCAQWAELALEMGDLFAAGDRARHAWEQGLYTSRWGDWYSQFQERIRLRKTR